MLESGTLTLGINYWASQTAARMWRDWHPDEIERDLRLLAESGFTLLRVFPTWNDFQPLDVRQPAEGNAADPGSGTGEDLPGTSAVSAGVDEQMMDRFSAFCDLAEQYHLKLIVCILTGQMTGRLFIPRALERRNLYTDPVALKWEARYVEYFVRRMKHHPAISAWESGNETNYLGIAENSARVEAWLRYIHSTIRLADPERPVIGVNGLNISSEEAPWLSRLVAQFSDFVTVHPYIMWGKAGIEEFNGIRSLLFCPAQSSGLEQITGKPAFVEETGLWRPMTVSLEGVAKYLRGMLWNLWSANCRGMLWWCAFDQERFDSAPYDWSLPGLEHGLFSGTGDPRPGAEIILRFRHFLDRLNFSKLPEAKADALFLVSGREILHSSFILARQAGIVPRYQSTEEPLRDARIYFLPSLSGRILAASGNWKRVREKVRSGATLFLVWDEPELPGWQEVCGIDLVSRREGPAAGPYGFGGFSLQLPHVRHTVFRAGSARILGTDREGNPCFFRNSYGKGSVYTLTFPLERLCYDTAGLYDSDAWKLYAEAVPKEPLVSVFPPCITESEHFFNRDEAGVVLVNNSMKPFCGAIRRKDGWETVSWHTDAPEEVRLSGDHLSMNSNSGILLILKQKNSSAEQIQR